MDTSKDRTIAQFITDHVTIEDAFAICSFFAAALYGFTTTISVGTKLVTTVSLMLFEDPIQVGKFIDQYTAQPAGDTGTYNHDL